MEIIEKALVAKHPAKKSEDGIVITPDFIAVIDGSTSKTSFRHSWLRSNGRQAMLLISRYLQNMPKDITCDQFLLGITAYIRHQYRKSLITRLSEHPEERLTASVAVFSRLHREVWMIGDCHCLIGNQYYDNPKPTEAELAAMRAHEVRRLLAQGKTKNELLRNDTARSVIIPYMLETMQQQNITYSVVDGFPIPRQHVRQITLDFRPWEIVLATDGYPFLCPTLKESERRLLKQRENDPLNIDSFYATKGFHPEQNSFDDRTYIRFRV